MKVTWFRKKSLPLCVLCLYILVTLLTESCNIVLLSIPAAAKGRLTGHPAPFLHRPYYGFRQVLQRSISFFDHDKPWYADDGLFVRFDGVRSTRSMFTCSPYSTCYDGHNGYDLNMWFEPVLSADGGRVIRAGWYNALNHSAGLGLWVAIDHGNGMTTAYGHLSSLLVRTGDVVGTQWQVGTSGTTGASTGPHMHMAVYYMPRWQATDPFGWTGHYRDPNVVPDHFLWVNPPGTKMSIPYLSGNGRAVYAGATLVAEGGRGWSSVGAWRRAAVPTSIHGHLRWTTTSATGATATATWRPALPAAGYYEVAVFVDDTHSTSSWVPYTVYSADPHSPARTIQHTVYVDESHIGSFHGPYGNVVTGAQWVSIGTYYFSKAQDGRVMVSNATGERGLQIAADSVEFVPV